MFFFGLMIGASVWYGAKKYLDRSYHNALWTFLPNIIIAGIFYTVSYWQITHPSGIPDLEPPSPGIPEIIANHFGVGFILYSPFAIGILLGYPVVLLFQRIISS